MAMAMFQAKVRANNSGHFEGTAHKNVGFRGKRARKFTRTSPRTLPLFLHYHAFWFPEINSEIISFRFALTSVSMVKRTVFLVRLLKVWGWGPFPFSKCTMALSSVAFLLGKGPGEQEGGCLGFAPSSHPRSCA